MVGWFRKSRPNDAPAPLCDWIGGLDATHVARTLEAKSKTAETGTAFLEQLILLMVGNCARALQVDTGAWIKARMPDLVRDVLAFESLAFCFYAVRERHLPTPDDPFDDDEAEAVVDAYRVAMTVLPGIVAKLTGWEVADLWRRRVLFYFQRRSMKDATEAFAGTLLTLDGAREPARDYGRLSRDLSLNLELRARVHAFASTIPAGVAEGIQGVIVEYGLD